MMMALWSSYASLITARWVRLFLGTYTQRPANVMHSRWSSANQKMVARPHGEQKA